MFSYEFCEIPKNTFLHRTPLVAGFLIAGLSHLLNHTVKHSLQETIHLFVAVEPKSKRQQTIYLTAPHIEVKRLSFLSFLTKFKKSIKFPRKPIRLLCSEYINCKECCRTYFRNKTF